jgi:hypothetical protein
VAERMGSAQESVKVIDLRGFLKSVVFGLGLWPMAVYDENGQNLRLRYGNGAPGDSWRFTNGSFSVLTRRLETRIQRGFPHFHSDDWCGDPCQR